MKTELSQKQTQTLSPQMILSGKILQMGTQELLEHIETIMQENPVLEAVDIHDECDAQIELFHELKCSAAPDSYSKYNYQQNNGFTSDFSPPDIEMEAQQESLYDHVLVQLRAMDLQPQLTLCAEFLAGCLNGNGWIDEDMDFLAVEFGQPPKLMEQALTLIQSLEPPGIGARSLSECLCLQLKRCTNMNQLAYCIAANHLEALAKNQYALIARVLNVSQDDVRRAAGTIRALEPRPGAAFAPQERIGYSIPDIIVVADSGHFEIRSNEYFLP